MFGDPDKKDSYVEKELYTNQIISKLQKSDWEPLNKLFTYIEGDDRVCEYIKWEGGVSYGGYIVYKQCGIVIKLNTSVLLP